MKNNYLVVGLGVSGQAAVHTLNEYGAHTCTADDKKPADYSLADINDAHFDFSRFNAVITSPGFKPATDFVIHAGLAGVPVISDVQLAWQLSHSEDSHHNQMWIGITGTNGKTTTTEMTTAIMNAVGRSAVAAGNIGYPITNAVTDENIDTVVAELSSFQLHYTDGIELDCAAITNLADDHLDWHGGFDGYESDKAKIFRSVKKAAVFNADDTRVSQLAQRAHDGVAPGCIFIGFTLGAPRSGEIGVEDGWIINRSHVNTDSERIAPISSFTYLTEPDGSVYPHLLADALCALALAIGAGVNPHVAVGALQEFKPSGHRIETVATLGEGSASIRFVDDSKATNAHAARASLSSFAPRTVVWIAGGLAKGAEFGELVKTQAQEMKAAVIIGVDQQPMLDAFSQYAPELPLTVIDPESVEQSGPIMKQAVDAAVVYAQPGDVILMAPACASMDQFVSYADRGDQFARYSQEWVSTHAC